ncbi:MAG: hypothetical protein U1A78_10980 [Polyangia bacterium]
MPLPSLLRWSRSSAAGLLLRAAVGVTLLVAAAGCASSPTLRAQLDRQSRGDRDLLALLPPDLDAALDLDVVGLQKLESADAVLELLKPGPSGSGELRSEAGALPLLQTLVDEPLRELEALCAGVSGIDLDQPEIVVVARGPLQVARVREGVRRSGEVREVEYHGIPVIEAPERAAALLTSRTAAVGSRLAVRRVIDIFRSVDEGAREQAALQAALGRAPRARTGRPALLFASLLPAAMRKRAARTGLSEPLAGATFLSGALAVGDGVDLGVVLGYGRLDEAQRAAGWLRDQAAALAQRPALRFLGAARLVEPLQVIAAAAGGPRKVPEVHLAYRLPGDELQALLKRIDALRALLGTLGTGAGASD